MSCLASGAMLEEIAPPFRNFGVKGETGSFWVLGLDRSIEQRFHLQWFHSFYSDMSCCGGLNFHSLLHDKFNVRKCELKESGGLYRNYVWIHAHTSHSLGELLSCWCV